MTAPTDAAAIVRTIAGPWGPLHLAATERGIVAVESAVTVEAFSADGRASARRAGSSPEADADPSDPRHALLDRGDAGDRRRCSPARRRATGPRRPRRIGPAWDRHVLAAVRDVPWGRTASYGEIARRIGAPRAARAVGGALGRNPIDAAHPVPPGHRRRRDDRRLRRRCVGIARGGPRAQACPPVARGRHGGRAGPIDSAPRPLRTTTVEDRWPARRPPPRPCSPSSGGGTSRSSGWPSWSRPPARR